MHPRIDDKRRELARQVRRMTVEAFHDQLAEAGVTRAYVVWENGEFTLSHPKLLEPIQAFFELSQDFAGHEGVFIGREDGVPSVFFAAVHDTRRGLAQGGLRFKPYNSVADVLVDNMRLAQGMTRKNSLAGLWWGGGKGVVPMTEAYNNPTQRTPGDPMRLRLFEAYGRFVASLNGFYYTAEDVGTTTSDMNALHAQNRFTTCIGVEHGGSGNPSPFTARGVFLGMQAGWQYLHGTPDLAGAKVAIQGVGHVGIPLVESLDDAGAQVWVSDIDRAALERLKEMRPRIELIDDLDSIYDLDVDVFAPCAIGAVVNQKTIPRLKVKMVCGAANNILAEPGDAERLRERGIIYMPDYLVNRMGVTNCCDENFGYLQDDVELAAEHVFPDALRVLRHAERHRITTAQAADQLADIAAAELHPLIGHRGRRLIDNLIASDWAGTRGRRKEQKTAPLFEHGRDEPGIRVRWEREGYFRGTGRTIAAAPISTSGRPDLSSFFSAVYMDVYARAFEILDGQRPRRIVGSDHGGLALQLAVERSISYERDDVGRARFVELCQDVFRRHDAAIRQQLHQMGVGFHPASWLDSMSHQGSATVERLVLTLKDAGLLVRQSRRHYFDPVSQTVLTAPDEAPVEKLRGRSTESLEDHGVQENLFVRLDEGARHLERAIANESVVFSAERWKSQVLKAISEPELWDISRHHWWGHPVPAVNGKGQGEGPEVLSVWFSLAAWTLQAMGWPGQATPEPIDEVYVDPDLLMRWVIPSQVVALQLTGRPAFRRVGVHGSLYVPERRLEEREDSQPTDHDEERFTVRRKRVRMRRQLGNVVEPATLVQRFGADALRLGFLLAANPGTPEVATWAQSTVRQGRRTIRRLNAKVSGLDQLFGRLETHGEEEGEATAANAGRLVDAWIRAAMERVVEEAHGAYREHRSHDAAQLLVKTVDEFGRYSALAANRRGAALRSVAVTTSAVVERLSAAFSPICPYLFDKLCAKTAARAAKFGDEKREILSWIDGLVHELDQHEAVTLKASEPEILELLRSGREELGELTKAEITVEEGEAPDGAKAFGPVAVVLS